MILVRPLGFWCKVLHFWLFILPLWQHGCSRSGRAHPLHCERAARRNASSSRRGSRRQGAAMDCRVFATCRDGGRCKRWRVLKASRKSTSCDNADRTSHGWLLRCWIFLLSRLTPPRLLWRMVSSSDVTNLNRKFLIHKQMKGFFSNNECFYRIGVFDILLPHMLSPLSYSCITDTVRPAVE